MVRDGRHIFVNRKMLDIFGYALPNELVGQPISKLIHPQDLERVQKWPYGDSGGVGTFQL